MNHSPGAVWWRSSLLSYRPFEYSRRFTVPPVVPPLITLGVAFDSMYDFTVAGVADGLVCR